MWIFNCVGESVSLTPALRKSQLYIYSVYIYIMYNIYSVYIYVFFSLIYHGP